MYFLRFVRKAPFRVCFNLFAKKCQIASQLLVAFVAAESLPQPDFKKPIISSPDTLTHEFLLKQSSGAVVTAVAQLLHQTVTAYVDVAENYKKSINKHIGLIEEFLNNLGDLTAEEKLSDSIIECRAIMKKKKDEFLELESLLSYIMDLVNSTTQATFLAGSEYLSLTLCEQLASAKLEIQRAKREIENTEQLYLTAEKEAIEKERNDEKEGEKIFLLND